MKQVEVVKEVAVGELQATLKWLVDTVNGDQVCTTSSVVCRLDINTIESEKTAEPFSAPFRLIGTRSDVVHALVGYARVCVCVCACVFVWTRRVMMRRHCDNMS